MSFDSFGLTPRRRLFCEHYLSDGKKNGEKAAIAAGFAKGSAAVTASQLLTYPNVKNYIEKRMKETFDKLGVGIEYRVDALKKCVEAGLSGQASGDGSVDINGVVKTISEFNKMDGSYAPVKNETELKIPDLENATTIADAAEKEIDKVREF